MQRRYLVSVPIALVCVAACVAACGAFLHFTEAERKEEARERAEQEARRGMNWELRDPAVTLEKKRIVENEAVRWAHLIPDPTRSFAAVLGESWINLGPTNTIDSSGSAAPDAGRLTGVVMDPRDPNIVYIATSGGGVWKTWSFDSSPNPTWRPITEHLDNLAVGAIEISASEPDTIWIGFGDAYDVSGSAVGKSVDGGSSWTIIPLSGRYPAASGGLDVIPLSVRDIEIDPQDATNVFVATDVGLFVTHDGGTTFSLIDLPNDGVQLAEATWSIAYAGQRNNQSTWVVSGVYACDVSWIPPWAGISVAAGNPSRMKDNLPCTFGNPGDIWKSTDSGATWTSLRASNGTFPSSGSDFGPAILAVAPAADPAMSTIYALLGNNDEENNRTIGIWRSRDGGTSWRDATGTLSNPTSSANLGCTDLNIAHDQAWYDLAIAVDPLDADRVIAGGNYCGIRTQNGTATNPSWANISHWAPGGNSSETSAGTLPYVHADWHFARVVHAGAHRRVFVGSDGGFFVSDDVLENASPPNVVWEQHNEGVATHLIAGIGSGDPADGNYPVVVAGLQDNGTLYRDASSTGTTFRKILGGDGFQASVGSGTSGQFILGSQQYSRYLCIDSFYDCSDPNSWQSFDPQLPQGDEEIFVTKFSMVQPNPTGGVYLSISKNTVWRANILDPNNPFWVAIGTFDDLRYVFASQNIRQLYGVTLKEGRVAVTSDAGTTWTTSAQLGLVGTPTVAFASSIAFPPTTPAGKTNGDVYVASSGAWTLGDRGVIVPEAVGHLFYTEDRGTTFTALHGNGTGGDLPNVPITVARYDPGDLTNNTIYVGTEIGLYRTRDAGATWERYGYGLPFVQVSDIFIAKNSSIIRVGTYGRGVWEINVSSTALPGVAGDGDFDRDQVIDWRDLGALSSRLGTTPAVGGWPSYTWIDDFPDAQGLTSGTIDEDDLSTLLGLFGGHP